MRILIVGGGIAGLTLAALLNGRDHEVLVVEKTKQYIDRGYVIALWPAGSRILKGPGLYSKFELASQPLRKYVVKDRNGAIRGAI